MMTGRVATRLGFIDGGRLLDDGNRVKNLDLCWCTPIARILRSKVGFMFFCKDVDEK
jgi:hypothetical protein